MIATHSGSYEGIGFALPSNMAVKVYNQIIREGRVIRGSIGIRWTRTGHPEDTLQAFGLDHGVLVEAVAPGGPAGKAGIEPDDVILSMNSSPIKDEAELISKVADLPVGSTAQFTVDRDGKQLNFTVPIEERSVVWKSDLETDDSRPDSPKAVKATPPAGKFGITIMRLTEKERHDMGIDDKNGVKIVAVDPGSFADDIGLQQGDAILSINRQVMAAPDDVVKFQANLKPGQAVAVHVVRSASIAGRHGQPQRYYLSGRLPE